MSDTTFTVEVPKSIFVKFGLDKCIVEKYNGDYENIEVDLSNLSGMDIVTLAERSIKISLQAVRNSKEESKYSFLDTKKIVFPKPGTRSATSPEKLEKKQKEAVSILSKLSPAELIEIYKKANVPVPPALLSQLDNDSN